MIYLHNIIVKTYGGLCVGSNPEFSGSGGGAGGPPPKPHAPKKSPGKKKKK